MDSIQFDDRYFSSPEGKRINQRFPTSKKQWEMWINYGLW